MVTVANQLFRQMFGHRPLAGLPLRTALPELADQAFFGPLDAVYATGTMCHGRQEITFRNAVRPGLDGPVHFTFIAQAVRDMAGAVEGLLLFVYDVSAHAQARQQVAVRAGQPPLPAAALELANLERGTANLQLATAMEVLSVTNAELDATNNQLTETNHDLGRANAQLHAVNDEIRAHVAELHCTQKVLRALNARLESRVSERTEQLQVALRDSEHQRATIAAVFAQTPAALCLLRGPEHRFAYVNDSYQALYPGRALQGFPLAEAMPEIQAQVVMAFLDQVFATGQPYHGQEVPLTDAGPHGPRTRFFDFTCQAFREDGAVVGVALCAFDVTEQVRVRE
ncbi:MAG: hypothetical protein JWP58_3819 [Hymenobacter sp.]|nr:hypothetical protein [Hymenobacter sp.]